MRIKLRHVLIALITFAFLFASLAYATEILRKKWEVTENIAFRKKEFLEYQEGFDVLNIGASGAMTSFSPLVLYEHFGIKSYNLSSSVQPPAVTYLLLKEAVLEKQIPNILVIDMVNLTRSTEFSNELESKFHVGLADLTRDDLRDELKAYIEEDYPDFDMINFNLPLYRYHDRWKEITVDDFIVPEKFNYNRYFLGSYTSSNVANIEFPKNYYKPNENNSPNINEKTKKYYDKILMLCKEHEISVVLLNPPRRSNTIENRNILGLYGKESNIEHLIDLSDPEIMSEMNLDPRQDFYDPSHVNIEGQRKTTEYIGEYLINNFGDTLSLDTSDSSLYDKYKSAYEEIYQDYKDNIG